MQFTKFIFTELNNGSYWVVVDHINHLPIMSRFPATFNFTGDNYDTWPVESGHFHGGNALHGAAYFKLLDDAAYFAAASIHTTSFLVTGMYSIKFIKPVYSGVITAKGVLAEPSGKYFKSSSRLFNESGELLAEGSGIFIPTTTLWSSLKAYHM